jgi:hypothetical protein
MERPVIAMMSDVSWSPHYQMPVELHRHLGDQFPIRGNGRKGRCQFTG